MMKNLYKNPCTAVALHCMIFNLKQGSQRWVYYREQLFGMLSVYTDTHPELFNEQYSSQWVDDLYHICAVAEKTFWKRGVNHE